MTHRIGCYLIVLLGGWILPSETRPAELNNRPSATKVQPEARNQQPVAAHRGWTQLLVEPKSIFLSGTSTTQILIVSAQRPDGSADDVTTRARFHSEDPRVVSVGKDGVVKAAGKGATYVRATWEGLESRTFVVVRDSTARPFSFASDIAPIISHFGCNGSSCHGALNGQNGFKLSLFGYDPEADYDAIVTKADGRRVDRSDPERSLILLKPTFSVPHGGGLVMDKGSPEYRNLRDWISQGAPRGTSKGPRLKRLDVYPKDQRVLTDPDQKQRLVVVGRYSDGTEVDMTSQVRYTSNNPGIATVSPEGLVTPVRDGETAIMVRSLGAVGVARVGVVLRPPVARYPRVQRNNLIDDLVFAKLARLNVVPSELCTDAEFIRRASLDITGVLARPEDVRRFLADRSDGKRARLVEELLKRPEYADFWSMKWGDLLTNTPQFLYNGTAYFQAWLRDALARNMPFDEFARELLTASGGTYEPLPSNFYSIMKKPEEMATFTSQVFLGVSLECARCHDHPSENWRRDDFMGLAAFFSQVKFKGGRRNNERFLYVDTDLEFKHPDTKEPVQARFLGGVPATFKAGEDRRARLAEWLTAPSNPYFARTAVNRVWKELMGRGIVDPTDDFRATNPPTHPELLDRLASDFVEHGFDLHHLMRQILNSRAYQHSSRPNETNKEDQTAYSRHYIRRLTAEQLLDAISQVTEVPERFPYFYPGKRATQLPDPIVDSYFLTIFDRASRENATCSRKQSISLTQSLHLVGGDTVNKKIRDDRGVLSRLIRGESTDQEILEHLYLAAVSRYPTAQESAAAQKSVAGAPDRRGGFEDVLWALLNSKEFLYNH
jgi:Protein of unknown function (DUF1553)/Protein of unknown function (DUF1549)/Bacterial Ig-like domain (group 2)